MTAHLKAGIFILSAIGALIYMTTRITQNRFAFAGIKRYHVFVKDATGLLNKSKVKMAGLDVGQVENIFLEGKRAKITVVVGGEVTLRKNAAVTVKSIGFLGDKYLELSAGTDDQPPLEEDALLSERIGGNSLDDLTEKVAKVVDNLQDITEVLKDAMKGKDEEGTRLERIAENLEDFTAGLASLNRMGDLTDKLDEVAANLRDITSKVNRGEGTIGKLVNDSETIDKLNSTLSGVNKFIAKADKLQIWLDARSGVLTATGGSKTAVNAWIQPTYDKYYLLGISSSPQGYTTRSKLETTSNGATVTTTETTLQQQNQVTFNAQFAKLFGDFWVRFGLFESQGGVALDYVGLLNHRLKLVAEIYNFQPQQTPQFNTGAELHVFKPFYVWAGGDDLLAQSRRNFFVGGGVRFSDSDVKTLITSVPR